MARPGRLAPVAILDITSWPGRQSAWVDFAQDRLEHPDLRSFRCRIEVAGENGRTGGPPLPDDPCESCPLPLGDPIGVEMSGVRKMSADKAQRPRRGADQRLKRHSRLGGVIFLIPADPLAEFVRGAAVDRPTREDRITVFAHPLARRGDLDRWGIGVVPVEPLGDLSGDIGPSGALRPVAVDLLESEEIESSIGGPAGDLIEARLRPAIERSDPKAQRLLHLPDQVPPLAGVKGGSGQGGAGKSRSCSAARLKGVG